VALSGTEAQPGKASHLQAPQCRKLLWISLRMLFSFPLALILSMAHGQQALRDSNPVASDAAIPASLHGVVVNSDGSLCQGVQIALTRPGLAGQAPSIQISDSNGSFSFAGVAPGPFKLTFTSAGFATKTLEGTLGPGEDHDVQSVMLLMAGVSNEVQVTASTEEIAQEQLHVEEQQRVLGAIPNFYVAYDPNAAPLTGKQKFQLAWKTSIDPVTFALTGVFAGIEQAENSFPGYGQGAVGYAKRFGANYTDGVTGDMIGAVALATLFKQDPRYFYQGTGTVRSRAVHAIASSVLCKGDNGHLQFNYSAILGGLASGGISNLYYPSADRNGWAMTFENSAIGTAESAVGDLLQEFLIRHLTPKVPKYNAATP
jgi:hypothetical protein